MNDTPSTDAATQGAAEQYVPWQKRKVDEMSQPPAPAPKDGERETKAEARRRRAQEAVAALKARGAAEDKAVKLANEAFRLREAEDRKAGRPVTWPYVEEIAEEILRLVEQAIPLADYSEFPGAPLRAGACTRSGLPFWVFRKWTEERKELQTRLARARDLAADSLADRHLHLAQVALEMPFASDAVRVAAEILRWQAMIRAPKRYSDRQEAIPQRGEVHIHIGTAAPAQVGRTVDGQVLVTEVSQPLLQGPDAQGQTIGVDSSGASGNQ